MSEPIIPPPPPGTAALFGDHWPLAQHYVRLLSTEAVLRGLIGPHEVSRIWTRHIRNSLAVAPFLAPGARVIDLGSGAGLPGIPVALARPDLRMVLLEPMQRRIAFLEQVAERLGLAVEIERARGETATARSAVVICRAVAPLARLLPLAHRLVDGSGELVALKGRSVDDEVSRVLRTAHDEQAWLPTDFSVQSVDWPDPAVVFRARWQQGGRGRRPEPHPSALSPRPGRQL